MKHHIKNVRVSRITQIILSTLLLIIISISAKAQSVTLEAGNFKIALASGECSQVHLAAQALQRDFTKVMGYNPDIVTTSPAAGSNYIVVVNDATDSDNRLTLRKKLEGRESHRIYCQDGHIVLHGKDMRGTIYAIYSFSEQFLGVPPLWYWCDWQPIHKDVIEVPAEYDYFEPSPTVQYRAWFPNDQDLFSPWRKKSTDNNERWQETMLRLKLNTVEYTATVTTSGTLNNEALLYKKYGLVLTSHHMVSLNNSFANWDAYWTQVRKTTPPTLSVNDMQSLREFWQYSIDAVRNSGVENLWQVAFRGKTDQPFWSVFSDAPTSDKERGEVITRMVKEQYDMICASTGESDPFVRMTFYDEISSLLAAGHIQPPVASNMLWTFVAGRRDHYPYDDLVAWQNEDNVKLGYYMNLQFYSTGAHLAPAEGPWKMEDNYRYVASKGPLTFSVVNAGNLREFMMEMSANAAMMWNSERYNTDSFLHSFCAQYFGAEHAEEVAQLYRDYYYAYWNPKKSDFPGGFDRQYVFQDLRHAQVIKQISDKWNNYQNNPLSEIGYESVAGRTFRIEGKNQVDSLLAGMSHEVEAFTQVAAQCEALQPLLPADKQTYFYDHLSAYAHYMQHLSKSVYHFVYAYKNRSERAGNLSIALEELKAAKKALTDSQHGVFANWYATDDKFDMDNKIDIITKLLAAEDTGSLSDWDEPQRDANGVYQIGTARELEWFSVFVAQGGDNLTACAALTADIDLAGITHRPIGPGVNDTRKFNGTFDGQHHRIKNMIINDTSGSNAGFFGFVRGTAKIKNVIIDKSCSVTAKGRAGGLIGAVQVSGGESNPLLILNCVNEANVTSTGNVAGGIFGGAQGSSPFFKMHNCVNTGDIKAASSEKAAAFVGMNNTGTAPNCQLWHCYNTGKVSPIDTGNQLFRGSYRSIIADFDMVYSTNTDQGEHIAWTTDDPVTSGELCWYLNNYKKEEASTMGITFKQEIGKDPMPMPITDGLEVYQNATFRCDGTPLSGVTYSNENRSVIPDHQDDGKGFCSVCRKLLLTSCPQDKDGTYLISNAAELEVYSSIVNADGAKNKINAKLTADIDMEGVIHTPIGYNDGNKLQGTFDGQGHRILNMTQFTQTVKVGLVGMARGGSTIKNVIIDKTCSLDGAEAVAGVCGGAQTAAGSFVTIENCINEASVNCTSNHSAGIFGKNYSANMTVKIINCGNTGRISGDKNACAIGSWMAGGSAQNYITNCWNTGEIVKSTWDKNTNADWSNAPKCATLNLYNCANPQNIIVSNTYDASTSELRTQGTLLEREASESGELAYRLNTYPQKPVWRQNLTDMVCEDGEWQTILVDGHPVLDATHRAVERQLCSIGSSGTTTFVTKLAGGRVPQDVTVKVPYALNEEEYMVICRLQDKIEAEHPVLLCADEATEFYLYGNVSDSGNPLPVNGLLHGVYEDTAAECGTYILGQQNERVVFYLVENDDANIVVPANQAYMTLSPETGNSQNPSKIYYITTITTGINGGPEYTDCKATIYNLAGQRLNRLQKGINIVGGHKVMVK